MTLVFNVENKESHGNDICDSWTQRWMYICTVTEHIYSSRKKTQNPGIFLWLIHLAIRAGFFMSICYIWLSMHMPNAFTYMNKDNTFEQPSATQEQESLLTPSIWTSKLLTPFVNPPLFFFCFQNRGEGEHMRLWIPSRFSFSLMRLARHPLSVILQSSHTDSSNSKRTEEGQKEVKNHFSFEWCIHTPLKLRKQAFQYLGQKRGDKSHGMTETFAWMIHKAVNISQFSHV